MGDMKEKAELIDDIQLKLADRYVFCCAPMDINHQLKKRIFVQEVNAFTFHLLYFNLFLPFSVCRKIFEKRSY